MRRRLVRYCGARENGRVCGLPQVSTKSGATCRAGHGGAAGLTLDELQNASALQSATVQGELPMGSEKGAGLIARDGDVLSVTYGGAKIALGNYSNVDLDGATFERRLREGESVEEQHALIYGFLKQRSLSEAREKLGYFSREVAKGRKS